MNGLNRIPPALIAGLVAFALYLPSLRAGFVWDDAFYVQDNESLRSWRYVPAYFYDKTTMASTHPQYQDYPRLIYRPVRNISYLIDFKIGERNPFVYHLHNAALHGLCAAFVCALAAALLGQRGAGLAAGLLFAVHPALTEAVAWIKCRDTLYSALFVLWAAWTWQRGLAMGRISMARVGAVLALYALALLSYLTALGALVLYPAIWLAQNREARAALRGPALVLSAGMLLISAAFLAIRHHVLGTSSHGDWIVDGGLWPTLISMLPATMRYAELLVFPLRLNADYDAFPHHVSLLEPAPLASAIVLAALAALWLRAVIRRDSAVGLAGLWILAFLAPVSNIVPTMQLLAERFLYLPAFGFVLLIGRLWQALQARSPAARRAVLACGLAVLALCVARVQWRLVDWSDYLRLHAATYRADPDNSRAAKNYGISLFNFGRYAEARAVLAPIDPATWNDGKIEHALAWSLAQTGAPEEALSVFAKARQRYPDSPAFCLDAAIVASELGRIEDALALLDDADRRFSLNDDMAFKKAVVLQNAGRADDATAIYLQLAETAPNNARIWNNLARLAMTAGDVDAARGYYERTRSLEPQNAEAAEMLEFLSDPRAP